MSIMHNFISKCDNEQAILQKSQAEPFCYDKTTFKYEISNISRKTEDMMI